MSTSESDQNTELLKSIASCLKAIHLSLENLNGAVEAVSESIEKAHEPEGDLGVHLVDALRELTSSLHKRAQQERTQQPQQRFQNQGRRDDRQQRHENQGRPERNDDRPLQHHPDREESHEQEEQAESADVPNPSVSVTDTGTTAEAAQSDRPRKSGGRGRGNNGRGRRGGKPPAQ
jgi:hypothetical protein